MAKMFYTMEETQQKLLVGQSDVKQLVREGRLREFRDGPRLMFKSDQVEELRKSKFGLMCEEIQIDPLPPAKPIAISLDDSFAGLNLADNDPLMDSGVTLGLSDSGSFGGLPSSGLLELTNEKDDSILGRDVLDEIFPPQKPKKKATPKIPDPPENYQFNKGHAVAYDLHKQLVTETLGKRERKSNWAPKPSLAWRLFVALFFIAIGFVIGFATCFTLLAT